MRVKWLGLIGFDFVKLNGAGNGGGHRGVLTQTVKPVSERTKPFKLKSSNAGRPAVIDEIML